MELAFKYTVFSIASTFVNIFIQYTTFLFYEGPFNLYIAMFLGTLSGLFLKYFLDKKYIFFHKSKNKKDNSKKFILYSFMGLSTTSIFWGFEILFNIMFDSKFAKYIGAILGLSIGYYIKYFLDKKFVFRV